MPSNRRTGRNSEAASLQRYLDSLVIRYNTPGFIDKDPISIPRQFTQLQDIEIMGFWTAMLSWGQRITIIHKSQVLIRLMDGAPYAFITQHSEKDLKRFSTFAHRTFQSTDTLYFIDFFKRWYAAHERLETAFLCDGYATEDTVEKMLMHFHTLFFEGPFVPQRTRKHVPTPASKSACKRLNMFLRWMVRKDKQGVDFGLWQHIRPDQLICPLDVHVERVARKLKLLDRKQTDWQAAVELTTRLKAFDPLDPVKYDFALFGIGLEEQAALRELNR